MNTLPKVCSCSSCMYTMVAFVVKQGSLSCINIYRNIFVLLCIHKLSLMYKRLKEQSNYVREIICIHSDLYSIGCDISFVNNLLLSCDTSALGEADTVVFAFPTFLVYIGFTELLLS